MLPRNLCSSFEHEASRQPARMNLNNEAEFITNRTDFAV